MKIKKSETLFNNNLYQKNQLWCQKILMIIQVFCPMLIESQMKKDYKKNSKEYKNIKNSH